MKREKAANVTLERTPSRIKVERLLALLSEGEFSRHQLAERMCFSVESADRYLRCLQKARKVYVKRWERSTKPNGGMPTAFWAAGDKKSAPRPRPLTDAEQNRRGYERMKREHPDKYLEYLMKARLKSQKKRRVVKVDPLWSWIPRRDMREAA